MTAHGHRVRFVATWREEFFEVPLNFLVNGQLLRAAVQLTKAPARHFDRPLPRRGERPIFAWAAAYWAARAMRYSVRVHPPESMLGTKNQEFQAIPAGNPEIEKRRRGALRPRAAMETTQCRM
jgi:hypothetical protein